MTGGGRGRAGVLPASAITAAEAALVVLTLALFGASGAGLPLPDWAPIAAPTLLSVAVLGRRLPTLWRALRGSAAPPRAAVTWAGLEALLAAGFLAVLAVVVVALLGTIGAAAAGAFDAAGSGVGFVVGSAVAAGFLALFLVMAVGGRLVVSAARAVGR